MENDVKFIRVNGRVVPIKAKKKKKRKKQLESKKYENRAYASGAATGGFFVAMKALHKKVQTQQGADYINRGHDLLEKDSFVKDWAPELKKIKNPNIVRAPVDASAHGPVFSYDGQKITNKRTIFAGPLVNDATMLHEMGHIAQSQKKGTMNRSYRKSSAYLMKDINKAVRHGESQFRDSSRKIKQAFKVGYTRPFTDLKAEYEATSWAYKTAKAKKGKKYAKHIMKTLRPAYGTYVARAGLTAANLVTMYNLGRYYKAKHSENKGKQNGK